MYIAHGIRETNGSEDRVKDIGINPSDFLPESRSLSHILRLSPYIKGIRESNKIRIGRILW